ncbi:MAG: P1 family peptidase [Chloroflexota bacterium]
MIPQRGPTDSLLDVPGVHVGQVERSPAGRPSELCTGVTAVVVPGGALGVADVRGGAPGTRETDALSPLASGERVHAVCLVGRSVFGLAAADGAAAELERRGIGLPIDLAERGRLVIPIVAAAVVFDFRTGDPTVRPTAADGRRAVARALRAERVRPASGRAGAGAGASIGGLLARPMTASGGPTPGDEREGQGSAGDLVEELPGGQGPRRGGVGHASLVADLEDGRLVVGALAVVNAAGGPLDGQAALTPGPLPDFSAISGARGNTVPVIVATNARLSKLELARVAIMAHDGIARAVRPSHTAVDGDVVFALAVPDAPETPAVTVAGWGPAAASIVGALAADAVSLAIGDALVRT